MGRGKQTKLLAEVDFGALTAEARKQVWSGAVPLQLHLHPSEITTLPGPSPFLVSYQFSLPFSLTSDLLGDYKTVKVLQPYSDLLP